MLMAVVGMINRDKMPRRQGRGRRAGRPLLALRRHRLDRHLHPRLPDSRREVIHEHRTRRSLTIDTIDDHDDPRRTRSRARAERLRLRQVAIVLAVMTGLEVALTYMGFPGYVFMPLLLILMIDQVRHRRAACSCTCGSTTRSSPGCSTAGCSWRSVVYGAALATFQFFARADRTPEKEATLLAEVDITANPWAFHPHIEVWVLVMSLAHRRGCTQCASSARRAVAPGELVVTRRQTLCFVATIVILWAASDWPMHDIGETYLYSAHMLQHMMLSYFLPPLALLATPEWLLAVADRQRAGLLRVAVHDQTSGRCGVVQPGR